MMNVHDALRSACAEVGIICRAVPADGRWHPTDIEGDHRGRGDGRIKLFPDGEGGIVRNWKGESKPFFVNDGRTLSAAERRERDVRRQQAILRAQQDEAQRRAEAAARATLLWNTAKPAPEDHPYLKAKGVKSHGLRVSTDGKLIVPLRADDKLWSMQMIGADGGEKFLPDGRVAGCYYSIGTVKDAPALCIVEGYATGASVCEVTGYPVAVAFYADNLERVAVALKAKYPNAAIIVCADDDYRTEAIPA